jgi:hypothetical protein
VAQTKRELFDLLADVPDDAPVYVAGATITVVAQGQDGHVVLDEDPDYFQDGGYRLLFGSERLSQRVCSCN